MKLAELDPQAYLARLLAELELRGDEVLQDEGILVLARIGAVIEDLVRAGAIPPLTGAAPPEFSCPDGTSRARFLGIDPELADELLEQRFVEELLDDCACEE